MLDNITNIMTDDKLIQQGITILRTIFPIHTTYTIRELIDPDGDGKIIDCEIGTTLPVSDAIKLLDKFDDEWWLKHARVGVVFTLKFNE